MFFHIDESGNTGNNLFDPNQPRLSYGVLSSATNVDALCRSLHRQIRESINDDIVHANALGIGGLLTIAPQLIQMQRKMRFNFDFFFIDKAAFALAMFFDAVFDAGLNKAVTWEAYWTPMRYLIIGKLARLFDESLLEESWRLCTAGKIDQHEEDIVRLLKELKSRAEAANFDKRGREIIADALDFGISQPLALDFGSRENRMISPNAIGFQFVTLAIARRTRRKRRKRVSSIVVDRQSQFNKAQANTYRRQGLIAEGFRGASEIENLLYLKHPLLSIFKEDDFALKELIGSELSITKSADSIGLQVADVYLWLGNKLISGVPLPLDLMQLWEMFSSRSMTDGISLEVMARRFYQYEQGLPEYRDLTDEQRKMAQAEVEAHRSKVRSLKST